jgi:hypothetical protein
VNIPARQAQLLTSAITVIGSFAIYAFSMLVLTVLAAIVLQAKPGAPTMPFVFTGLVVTAFASFAGGYAAAALAPLRPLTHVALVATMILIVQLSTVLSPPAGIPRWDPAALSIIGPVLALAGGYLRRPRPSAIQG